MRLDILVDRSPSMWRKLGDTKRIEVAKTLLRSLLEKALETHSGTRVKIAVFPGAVKAFPYDVVALRTLRSRASIDSIMRLLEDELTPAPTTPLFRALAEYIEAEARQGSHIIVITDGEVLSREYAGAEEAAAKAREKQVQVSFIVIGTGYPAHLKELEIRHENIRVVIAGPETALIPELADAVAEEALRTATQR